MRLGRSWLAMIAVLITPLSPLRAQQLTPDQQRIQELEKKIAELDRRLSAAEAKEAGAPAPKAAVAVAAPIIAPAPVVQTGSQRPTNAGVAAGTIPPVEGDAVGLVTVGPG